jgi:hypothetical protein
LKLKILQGEDLTGLRKPVRSDWSDLLTAIAEDVSRLPDTVFENPRSTELARLCLTPALQSATPSQLDNVIDALAGEMRNRRNRENAFVRLDLPDYVEMRGYILLMGGAVGSSSASWIW